MGSEMCIRDRSCVGGLHITSIGQSTFRWIRCPHPGGSWNRRSFTALCPWKSDCRDHTRRRAIDDREDGPRLASPGLVSNHKGDSSAHNRVNQLSKDRQSFCCLVANSPVDVLFKRRASRIITRPHEHPRPTSGTLFGTKKLFGLCEFNNARLL